MRVVVGLPGSSDGAYVEALKSAGADEFFLGYVPASWHRRLGFEVSPNRRYRRGQQVTDAGRLAELCAAAAPCPVSVTFNEHFLTSRSWLGEDVPQDGADSGAGTISPGPARILFEEALAAGVRAAIVASPAVAGLLSKEYPQLSIHMSGDGGAYNAAACRMLGELGVRRVIFPRELPFGDLAATASIVAGTGMELEAFVMGEPCVYDGARCFTEHGYGFSCDFCNHHSVRHITERGREGATALPSAGPGEARMPGEADALRLGKCGLCALPYLSCAGVTHVKVPGRASVALPAVRMVRAVLALMGRGEKVGDVGESSIVGVQRAARTLLGAPRLCREGRFCYFPELVNAKEPDR